jgi:hypothetical protein
MSRGARNRIGHPKATSSSDQLPSPLSDSSIPLSTAPQPNQLRLQGHNALSHIRNYGSAGKIHAEVAPQTQNPSQPLQRRPTSSLFVRFDETDTNNLCYAARTHGDRSREFVNAKTRTRRAPPL